MTNFVGYCRLTNVADHGDPLQVFWRRKSGDGDCKDVATLFNTFEVLKPKFGDAR